MEQILTDFQGRMVIKSIPEKTVNAYVKEVGASSFDGLTLQQKEKLFLLAIEDYYIGNLDLDELSALGTSLLSSLEDKNNKLAEALYAADELSYYIRSISQEHDRATNTLETFILEIKAFFRSHKPERAKEIFIQ